MDDRHGDWMEPDPVQIQNREEDLLGVFAIGDDVTLRGSTFRVTNILTRGRMMLKLLPRVNPKVEGNAVLREAAEIVVGSELGMQHG